MTEILKAKPLIKEIYSGFKAEIGEGDNPKLVVILIGEDPAAMYYVQNLKKKGAKKGIEVENPVYDTDITQKQLIDIIISLNNDATVHGVMLQKPLPKHLDEDEIVMTIDPAKDVDGFHPMNMGNLLLNREGFLPSTPAACLEMIKYYNIETSGKHIVVLGRSDIVGKPLANLLIRKDRTGNATVTICHSRTKNLAKFTQEADIVIAAIGVANFLTAEMVKQDAILIDVGVNQVEDAEKGYRYVGDIDYEDCFDKAFAITPVPGGVGSVTTAMLLKNVIKAFKLSQK